MFSLTTYNTKAISADAMQIQYTPLLFV